MRLVYGLYSIPPSIARIRLRNTLAVIASIVGALGRWPALPVSPPPGDRLAFARASGDTRPLGLRRRHPSGGGGRRAGGRGVAVRGAWRGRGGRRADGRD